MIKLSQFCFHNFFQLFYTGLEKCLHSKFKKTWNNVSICVQFQHDVSNCAKNLALSKFNMLAMAILSFTESSNVHQAWSGIMPYL